MLQQQIRPPFTEETARLKVQVAENAWNSRDPKRVALACSDRGFGRMTMASLW